MRRSPGCSTAPPGTRRSRGAPEEAAALTEQASAADTGWPDPRRPANGRCSAADYHFRAGDMARSRELIQSALTDLPSRPAPRVAAPSAGHDPLPPERLAARRADVPPGSRGSAGRPGPVRARRAGTGVRPAGGRRPSRCFPAGEGVAAVGRASSRSAPGGALARQGRRLRVPPGPRRAAGPAGQGRGARRRSEARSRSRVCPVLDPSLVRGLVLKWCDRLDEARLRLADRYRHALDRGDEASLPFLLYHFSELECWAGNWDAAEEYALEACRVADESRQSAMRPATLYSLALVRAHRGQVQQARELASEALALCDRTGNVPVRSMVLSVLGFIAAVARRCPGGALPPGPPRRGGVRGRPRGTERGEVPPGRDRGAGRPGRGRSRMVAHAAARGTGKVARASVGAGDGCPLPRPPRRPGRRPGRSPGRL